MAIEYRNQPWIIDDHESNLGRLLQGCLQNDRRSQRTLYRKYYAYGMSICLRYSIDRDSAVELLNEGFLKIFLNLKSFDISRSFKPWFRKILINLAINNYKNKLRRKGEVSLDSVGPVISAEKTISKISYSEIIDMILLLPPAYRSVFNLYVIEGYKHFEIADLLNIQTGTSKSNLAKAKQKLRTMLRSYGQEKLKYYE